MPRLRLPAVCHLASFPCPHFGNFARLDQPHRSSAAIAGNEIVRLTQIFFLRVRDRPQRQGQAIRHLLGDGDDLRLLGRQFQRGGLAYPGLLAFLVLLNGLVDGQDTDVLEDGLGVEAGGAAGFNTETILKNIRVLAIDQTIQEDEEGKKTRVGQTATLELTPKQAEIITVAQQMADRLTLALRAVADTQEKNLGEADYLVSGNGRRGTVRLIKSGEVSEVGARK